MPVFEVTQDHAYARDLTTMLNCSQFTGEVRRMTITEHDEVAHFEALYYFTVPERGIDFIDAVQRVKLAIDAVGAPVATCDVSLSISPHYDGVARVRGSYTFDQS